MLELLAMTGKKYDPDPTDVQGQVFFTATPGTDWTVPEGVYAISVVCIGGGQPSGSGNTYGKNGGDLRWKNKIPVTPGEILRIRASVATPYTSTSGQASNIVRKDTGEILLQAGGGGNTVEVSTPLGGDVGGGNGGKGNGRGGGGAGGYTGDGGMGEMNGTSGQPGSGGGGGGGSYYRYNSNYYGGGGGGTGVHGQGNNGSGGTSGTNPSAAGGGYGSWFSTTPTAQRPTFGNGPNAGDFGGGAGGSSGYNGSRGAVRIIWGKGREFPSTETQDV